MNSPAVTALARRADAGTVRLGPRDVAGLVLVGDMYGAAYDLLAAATVAAGVAMNGGLWPVFQAPPAVSTSAIGRVLRLEPMASLPHGIVDRLFGIGPGGWRAWLRYQGTLVAIIAAALVIMLVSSPVNRRALFLLAVPFALGAVMYLCSLISPPPPASAGNTLAPVPLLLILLIAIALSLGHRRRAGPGVPGRPAAPRDA